MYEMPTVHLLSYISLLIYDSQHTSAALMYDNFPILPAPLMYDNYSIHQAPLVIVHNDDDAPFVVCVDRRPAAYQTEGALACTCFAFRSTLSSSSTF
jgi:hypothetical protein